MKMIILIFFLSLTLTQEAMSRERNYEGKTIFNGSLGIGYADTKGFIVHAKPRLLKFVLPRLAIGMDAEFYSEKNYTRLGIGPTLDLHFFRLGDIDFILGQNILYAKESIHTPGLLATTSLGATYSLSNNFLIGLTFGKMYYLTKKDAKPKDPNFANISFVFIL